MTSAACRPASEPRRSPSKRLAIAALTALVALGPACAPTPYKSTLDPLALQAMQTQDLETSKKVAFAATVSVFQDLGYVIEEADFETGLITAEGSTQSRSNFWTGGTNMITPKATAFVEEIRPQFTRIRLNFVEAHTSRGYYGGGGDQDIPNEDPDFYDEVFTKIQEAVFIRSATE
jgi:hypothetical protein